MKTKKLTLGLVAVAAFALVGLDANTAEAAHGNRGFGIHIGGRNVHLDIGNPHGYRSHHVYRARHAAPHHYDWHDTSHFDYHPPSYQRHYNHFDYEPGHYDLHRTGHWDRHHSYHGW